MTFKILCDITKLIYNDLNILNVFCRQYCISIEFHWNCLLATHWQQENILRNIARIQFGCKWNKSSMNKNGHYFTEAIFEGILLKSSCFVLVILCSMYP